MTVTEHNTQPQGNPPARTVHFHYDWDSDEPLSAAIVSAVETLSKSDPTEFEVLYDRIDPDALDAIFEPRVGDDGARRNGGHVQFPLSGYEITVYGDGATVVRRLE